MIYFFIQKENNNCFATMQSQVYESWNLGLVLIMGVSKDSDLEFWTAGFCFKKRI